MDLEDLDLILHTEIFKRKYNMKWIIGNPKKIPEYIKSPRFSFSSRFDKDWYLTVQYSEEDSIRVFLNRDSKEEQPVRVECTTCVIDNTGKRLPVTVVNIFHSKETRVICIQSCVFSDSPSECNLNLEFSFFLYGLELETEVSYCDYEGVNDADEGGKKFANMMNNENLADVQIHIGKDIFTAHRYILCLRAPKFVERHFRYKNETTLYKMAPEIFKCFLSYIYNNEVCAIELSQCAKKLYEFAGKYDLKHLQKICTQELRKDLKYENVVEYLKMAENYKEESLKSAVSLFIINNLDAMYRRKDWTSLIAAHPNLESEVLHYQQY